MSLEWTVTLPEKKNERKCESSIVIFCYCLLNAFICNQTVSLMIVNRR